MSTLDNIVDVNIDLQTSAVVVAGFSLPMFLGLHKGFTQRYKEYGDINEVGVDFGSTTNEYKAALSYFGQSPSVNKIAIGRQNSTITTFTPVVADSVTYSVTLNGVLFTAVSGVSATATTIVTALIAAINAGTEPVTATGTTTLILTADVGGVAFSVKPSSNLNTVHTTTETLTDALVAVRNESKAFYGVNCYLQTKAAQLEVAAWASANELNYATSSNDVVIKNSTLLSDNTSIAVALKNLSYKRAIVIYSADAASYPECALFGGRFAFDAGKETYKFKQLEGISVDNLTTNEISNITSKNANAYITVAGNNILIEGTSSEGTFADIIRDTDVFKSRLQVAVFGQFINVGKIPFTEAGIAGIEGILRAECSRAQTDQILADDTPIIFTIPKVKDVSVNDRALRKLTGIKVQARIAGAIHSVVFNISITA